MTEQEKIDACQALIPGDRIVAAGTFQLHGTHAGFEAGLLLPGGAWAADGLATGAAMAGAESHAAQAHLPLNPMLAVSPTHIYLIEGAQDGLRVVPRRVVGVMDRSTVRVHVEGRVSLRILSIEDPQTGQRLDLEGPRHGVAHARDVIDALQG